MSATGTGKIVIGKGLVVTIAGTSYRGKRTTSLHGGTEVYKDSTAAGMLKTFGNIDDNMQVELYLQPADFSRIWGYTRPDSNGNVATRAVRVAGTSNDGTTIAITGNAYVHAVDLTDPDGEEKNLYTVSLEFDHAGGTASTS